ncbi:unnamed protein product [Prorocentrum cordatum]|uniref:JmjC domain-containing protein n=1 Tax=Prorocentrum cordatum TaxID=2364126 RepID=A0ABN9X259_9DINO|nr:unnamed protein product [Polarella glacialis]
MVRGSKRWALFPPRQAHNLYTVGEIASVAASGVVHYVNDAYGKSSSHGTHFSLVPDVFAPTDEILERFPLLREALPDRLEAELQPGELLFLPAGWFHQVHSFGEHMSVNFWWTPA